VKKRFNAYIGRIVDQKLAEQKAATEGINHTLVALIGSINVHIEAFKHVVEAIHGNLKRIEKLERDVEALKAAKEKPRI